MITRAVCRLLVGREEELSTLEDALLAAIRGEGSVVVLTGDAGIGKSRLCSELERRAEKIGAAVMEGSCSEADLALPYLPFLEAIGNFLTKADLGALREGLGAHIDELAKLFPQLAVKAAAAGGPGRPDDRLRLFEAVLALLRIAAEERGLLLIVEDLHWADASTAELLDYLTRRLRGARVLVLATYRGDEMHRQHPLLPILQGWQRSRLGQTMGLEPLPPESVARMVSSIFDDTDVGAEFRDFMHQRSEGNPFVVEEMLKAAMDRGDIYFDESDWRRKPIAELRIPDTVRDTILLRVERLDQEEADILRCAAVLGRSFDYPTLIGVSAKDRSVVESALRAAVQQQFLEEESVGQRRYRFRHALTQEAIYRDLSAPTRERLHSAAADVMSSRPDPPAAELAYHLRAADRWPEALAATLLAATEAERGYGYGEAAALYSLLLPVVPTGLERGRLLCRLGEAYFHAASPGQAVEPLMEGVRILKEGGETGAAARHQLVLGRSQWERGQLAAALAEYEGARDVLEELGPSRELAQAYIRLSGLRTFKGDPKAGQELAERAISIAELAGSDEMRIWATTYLGVAFSFQGESAACIEALERSAREAEDRGLFEIAGNALHNQVIFSLDDMQLDRIPEIVRRLRGLRLEGWSTFSSLYAEASRAYQSGAVAEALELARDLDARARRLDSGFDLESARVRIGRCLIELDQLGAARQWVARPDLERDAHLAVTSISLWLRFHIENGESPAAVEGAEMLLDRIEMAWIGDDAAETAAQALIAVGRVDDAAKFHPVLEAGPTRLARCTAQLVGARVALARGDPGPARGGLVESTLAFERAGLVLRECRARLLIAEVDCYLDDVRSAVSELRRVVDIAQSHELALLLRRARAALQELGVEINEAPPRAAAETMPEVVGERLVTVMFADVRGYSAMTAGTPPAEMVDRISAFQSWAAQEVERHLGVVDKFAGDAVMATFNVSGTQVDHAEHALEAAFALRDKAAMLDLPVGIGIATGAAIVGRLQSRANMSVIGEVTNLAARLQTHAKGSEILLSEEANRRLRNRLAAKAENLDLKGVDKPVTAYRVPAPV